MVRWVRKDRRVYDFSTCKLCGSACGVVKPAVQCAATTCLACGSRQCMSNGLARGTCSICLVGLLPGWSGTDRSCSYAGCAERAVARADGQNAYRCCFHLERGKWAGYAAARLAEREKYWVEVVD